MHSSHIRYLITVDRSTFAIYELSVLRDIKISLGVMRSEIQTTISSNAASSKHRNIFDERYHVFNKRLLCAAGLWPDHPLKQKRARVVGVLIASCIFMAAQVRALLRGFGQFNYFIQCTIPMGMNFLGVFKIISGMAHTHEMRKLFDQMQQYWDDTRCLPHINILEKCGEKGRSWTLFYLIKIYLITAFWVVMACVPKIMDTVAPLNYSRRRLDIIPIDFMVDPDVYFYPILIVISFGMIWQLLITVAMDTLYMVLAQHVCAMFEILSWNLQNVLHDHESALVILEANIHEDMHYHEIISCIKSHKVIIEFVNSIESTCEWKLLALVGMNMWALSFTGYMVIVTHDDSVAMDTLRYTFLGFAQLLHLFCNTLPGHWIMNSSSCIPHSAYSSRWYLMSLRSRKLILFLIRASIEPCNITAGKIYVMSVENFSAVLRTSVSYLAMLNSMQ